MLRSFLHLPDLPESHHDQRFSAEVAVILRESLPRLSQAASGPDALPAVRNRLLACLRLPMSRKQRARVVFALALANSQLGDAEAALEWLDEALDLVTRIDEHAALSELLYLRAEQHQRLFEYSLAASDYQSCLSLLHLLDEREGPVDPGLEVRILVRLAGVQFFRGLFEDCQTLLDDARTLLARLPSLMNRLDWAGVEWIQALVDRWKGMPELALLHAMPAADVYQMSGNAGSFARIQVIVADIALDLCERAPGGPESSQHQAFLILSKPYIERALCLTREARDHTGEALALLSAARHSRLSGHADDNAALIERVARTATQSADVALLAQAFTALGDLFRARGESEAALNLYRQTLVVLEDYDVPAFGARAHRALLRASEIDGVDI